MKLRIIHDNFIFKVEEWDGFKICLSNSAGGQWKLKRQFSDQIQAEMYCNEMMQLARRESPTVIKEYDSDATMTIENGVHFKYETK